MTGLTGFVEDVGERRSPDRGMRTAYEYRLRLRHGSVDSEGMIGP